MLAILIALVFTTSFISGVIGMAGGIILMGALSLSMGILSAMLLHGFTQLSANLIRSMLLRKHIQTGVLPYYLIGCIGAFLLLSYLNYYPNKEIVLISIGLFPFIAIGLPKRWNLDISQRRNGIFAGLLVGSAQIFAGASGPVQDVFFINSKLNRYEVIATKSVCQVAGHFLKIIFYGKLLLLSSQEQLEFSPWIMPPILIATFAGTKAGKAVLGLLSEQQFQKYSRIIIAMIGGFYVMKGLPF